MATEILRPNAQGDKDELVLSIGGSTKWGASVVLYVQKYGQK
jgi:hypothetical protein